MSRPREKPFDPARDGFRQKVGPITLRSDVRHGSQTVPPATIEGFVLRGRRSHAPPLAGRVEDWGSEPECGIDLRHAPFMIPAGCRNSTFGPTGSSQPCDFRPQFERRLFVPTKRRFSEGRRSDEVFKGKLFRKKLEPRRPTAYPPVLPLPRVTARVTGAASNEDGRMRGGRRLATVGASSFRSTTLPPCPSSASFSIGRNRPFPRPPII